MKMKMNENNKIGLIMLAITALFFGMYLYVSALPTNTYTEEQERNFSLDEEHESIKAEIETQTSVILKTAEEYETPIKTEEVSDKIPVYTIDGISEIPLDEFYEICRVVMNESGGEPYQTQVAVAETIINRVNSDKFPNTVIQVLYQPYQYSHYQNGEITDSVREAVTQALEQHIYDTDMMYFREDYYHEFAEDYFYINNMYFSKGGGD